MEHILISPGKLKLMLTRGDVERYDLVSAVDGDADPESRQAFRTLLADAEQLGFDPGNDRLFIQLYPSKDGGAEIYITRLGSRLPQSAGQDGRGERLSVTRIGCFDTLDELAGCCKQLQTSVGKDSDSSAWVEAEPKRWFLVVSELLTYRQFLDDGLKTEAIIGEFGRNVKTPASISYIKEHCFNFCEKRAVKILGDMI